MAPADGSVVIREARFGADRQEVARDADAIYGAS